MIRRWLAGACCGVLVACAGPQPVLTKSGDRMIPLGEAAHDRAPAPDEVPANLAMIPDAVPRAEPLARSGNLPEYEVFGQTYRVLDRAKGFRQRGRASWYGKRFHGRKTASGETYDMYAMSGAHKTLPLPSYVRVTHVKSGRSVIVRVNDRGPFVPDRVIDLSYAAALKLGIISYGHAPVELEVLEPHEPAPGDGGYLQVASFEDPINAVVMREDLAGRGISSIEIWATEHAGTAVNRVVIGPFESRDAAQATHQNLLAQGMATGWVTK